MSFKSMPNALQDARASADRQGRQCRTLPLGALIGAIQGKLGGADKSPWPVWNGSTSKPVQFQPMPRRVAVRKWHDARRYERQTRQKGKQDGALGRNGLAVLHAFLFDFLNHRTGQLAPTRATIARAANISIRSVDRGLAKLKAAGVINWIRRCAEEFENGVYRLRQMASAYFVLAQNHWLGFWQAAQAPLPYPEAWGRTPPLPDPITEAQTICAAGGTHAAQLMALEADPRDGGANALARLFRLLDARKR